MELLNTDNPGYVKDMSTGFIINNNDNEYLQILSERERLKQHSNMCLKMKEIETELSEIKSLLLKVVNKG